jgi:hypothetical protein
MPKGNSIHPTGENPARESILGIVTDLFPLLRSKDPRSWELAAMKLDEAADIARREEVAIIRRGSAVETAAPTEPRRPVCNDPRVVFIMAPGFPGFRR